MKNRFTFELTDKQFNQTHEQAVLVQYVREHRNNLFSAVTTGIAFLLAGVYAFSLSASLIGGLFLALGCVVSATLVWMEQTGWRIKRELTKLRKENSLKSTQAVVCVEVQDECLRVLADGTEVSDSAYNLNSLRSVYETEQAFLLNFKDGCGYILPITAFRAGTPNEFREYLRTKTKKYYFYHFTEKVQSFMK